MASPPWIGPQGQRMRRLELHLTYTCPERCVFCSEDTRMNTFRRLPVTWGRVAKTLRDQAERGVEHLHITGGEPTIHPRFVQVLQLAKRLGMRTSIGTIGTRLSQREHAERILPFLDEALFSVHGPDAATHDALTRSPGSFDKQMAAIALASELKPDFHLAVNTVMVRDNVRKVPDTCALLDSVGAQLIVVSNTTPEGAALGAYEQLAVPLQTLAEVLPRVPERVPNAVLRFFGVPMCLLGPHRLLSNDLHWDPRVTVEWGWLEEGRKAAYDGIYSWSPMRKRSHVAECEGCGLTDVCMGVYTRYAELWPTSALSPQPRWSP